MACSTLPGEFQHGSAVGVKVNVGVRLGSGVEVLVGVGEGVLDGETVLVGLLANGIWLFEELAGAVTVGGISPWQPEISQAASQITSHPGAMVRRI